MPRFFRKLRYASDETFGQQPQELLDVRAYQRQSRDLQVALKQYCDSLERHTVDAHLLSQQLRATYPSEASLSGSLEAAQSLPASGELLGYLQTWSMVLQSALDPELATIAATVKQREVARKELAHYEDKMAGLVAKHGGGGGFGGGVAPGTGAGGAGQPLQRHQLDIVQQQQQAYAHQPMQVQRVPEPLQPAAVAPVGDQPAAVSTGGESAGSATAHRGGGVGGFFSSLLGGHKGAGSAGSTSPVASTHVSQLGHAISASASAPAAGSTPGMVPAQPVASLGGSGGVPLGTAGYSTAGYGTGGEGLPLSAMDEHTLVTRGKLDTARLTHHRLEADVAARMAALRPLLVARLDPLLTGLWRCQGAWHRDASAALLQGVLGRAGGAAGGGEVSIASETAALQALGQALHLEQQQQGMRGPSGALTGAALPTPSNAAVSGMAAGTGPSMIQQPQAAAAAPPLPLQPGLAQAGAPPLPVTVAEPAQPLQQPPAIAQGPSGGLIGAAGPQPGVTAGPLGGPARRPTAMELAKDSGPLGPVIGDEVPAGGAIGGGIGAAAPPMPLAAQQLGQPGPAQPQMGQQGVPPHYWASRAQPGGGGAMTGLAQPQQAVLQQEPPLAKATGIPGTQISSGHTALPMAAGATAAAAVAGVTGAALVGMATASSEGMQLAPGAALGATAAGSSIAGPEPVGAIGARSLPTIAEGGSIAPSTATSLASTGSGAAAETPGPSPPGAAADSDSDARSVVVHEGEEERLGLGSAAQLPGISAPAGASTVSGAAASGAAGAHTRSSSLGLQRATFHTAPQLTLCRVTADLVCPPDPSATQPLLRRGFEIRTGDLLLAEGSASRWQGILSRRQGGAAGGGGCGIAAGGAAAPDIPSKVGAGAGSAAATLAEEEASVLRVFTKDGPAMCPCVALHPLLGGALQSLPFRFPGTPRSAAAALEAAEMEAAAQPGGATDAGLRAPIACRMLAWVRDGVATAASPLPEGTPLVAGGAEGVGGTPVRRTSSGKWDTGHLLGHLRGATQTTIAVTQGATLGLWPGEEVTVLSSREGAPRVFQLLQSFEHGPAPPLRLPTGAPPGAQPAAPVAGGPSELAEWVLILRQRDQKVGFAPAAALRLGSAPVMLSERSLADSEGIAAGSGAAGGIAGAAGPVTAAAPVEAHRATLSELQARFAQLSGSQPNVLAAEGGGAGAPVGWQPSSLASAGKGGVGGFGAGGGKRALPLRSQDSGNPNNLAIDPAAPTGVAATPVLQPMH